MPLPAALVARLKRRGLVKANSGHDDLAPEEEVIAEDYDDHSAKTHFIENVDSRPANPFLQESILESLIRESGGADKCTGCPNKYNIYHLCSKFCQDQWKLKPPSPTNERKRIKMLKKYPLPAGWKEIYDPGVGRHYYWRMGTEDVSWLPPTHPRSKITPPANKLRAIFKEELEIKKTIDSVTLRDMVDLSDADDSDLSNDDDDEEEEEIRIKEKKKPKLHEKFKLTSNKWRLGKPNQVLDPMDPAAYSECGRGTWSTGLEKKGEAKTGADVTASGPLYQMRPYPSPGAVLRMNAGIKPGEEKPAAEEDDED